MEFHQHDWSEWHFRSINRGILLLTQCETASLPIPMIEDSRDQYIQPWIFHLYTLHLHIDLSITRTHTDIFDVIWCVCERERERERERAREKECVRQRKWERERKSVWDREREREREIVSSWETQTGVLSTFLQVSGAVSAVTLDVRLVRQSWTPCFSLRHWS